MNNIQSNSELEELLKLKSELNLEAKKLKFDEELSLPFESEMIDYGIIKGNNTVLFIKAGANGSVRGYADKYLIIGRRIHKKYGCTIVCSSNPFAIEDSIGQGIEVIEKYVQKPYKIFYMGHSNGASQGARSGYKYPQIKRMLLINPTLMLNFYKIKDGGNNFTGEKMIFVIGEDDPSRAFLSFLNLIDNPSKEVVVYPKADHQFIGMLQDFIDLPMKYLL